MIELLILDNGKTIPVITAMDFMGTLYIATDEGMYSKEKGERPVKVPIVEEIGEYKGMKFIRTANGFKGVTT